MALHFDLNARPRKTRQLHMSGGRYICSRRPGSESDATVQVDTNAGMEQTHKLLLSVTTALARPTHISNFSRSEVGQLGPDNTTNHNRSWH